LSIVADVIPDMRADAIKLRTDEANVSGDHANSVADASSIATWKVTMAVVVAFVLAEDISSRASL
jgi:hypothetical protein